MAATAILRRTTHYVKHNLQKILTSPAESIYKENNPAAVNGNDPKTPTQKSIDLLDNYTGLRIKYYINQHCQLRVIGYKFIPKDEFEYQGVTGLDSTAYRFFYTLLDHKQQIVDMGTLPELDNFPFLASNFFKIRVPFRKGAERIKIYRNENLLISHKLPTANLRLETNGI